MRHFLAINDIKDINEAIQDCMKIKQDPLAKKGLGEDKTLGLIFMNPSLRTKVSTMKAAQNLGLNILPIDFQSSWALAYDHAVVMNQDESEHIKEAAQVIEQYCDIVGIRAFAELQNKQEDEKEKVFSGFLNYTNIPVINLESALAHPLQTLADILTIETYKPQKKPKVVLTWAPHVKPLPHAVANSFVEGMQLMDYDFVVTHPPGYKLDACLKHNIPSQYDQDKALQEADFVYVKNWSSTSSYGQVINQDPKWMINMAKLQFAPSAKVMHCLPVRRNLVMSDDVLDGPHSIVIEQAANRLYAAQYVLSKILEGL
ncbi:Rossmann-fold NAD(P)-binding domain-containing protein [Facilibium subflavum]|uniref:acetylornithine carbamoyltransferase n=1 Tax=Facilibium subflavum TaxID=2219058 RepID=UPI000E64A0AC|nr:acetylornithine carbamoyltransferase [Facilibium subflavum]